MIAIRQVAQGLRQARVTPSLPAVARRCFSEQPGDDLPPRATDLQAASGIPPVAPGRTVYIYSPSRVAGQHGLAQTIEGGALGGRSPGGVIGHAWALIGAGAGCDGPHGGPLLVSSQASMAGRSNSPQMVRASRLWTGLRSVHL